MIQHFTAHTINFVCKSIRSMFIVLGMCISLNPSSKISFQFTAGNSLSANFSINFRDLKLHTIKVSKWHKNGMNSIKMIKPSFTRNWSYKHSDLFLRNSFREFTTIFLGIPNGISLHLFTRMTKIYRLHRIQNMTLQFSNEYLYFRSLCNYIKSQNQTHLSVTLLNDG